MSVNSQSMEYTDVPEDEVGLDVSCLVPLVTDKKILPVVDLAILTLRAQVRRSVLNANGECEWQTSSWVDVSVDDIGDGIASFVS